MVLVSSPYFVLKCDFKTSKDMSQFSHAVDYYEREHGKEWSEKVIDEIQNADDYSGYLGYMERDSAKESQNHKKLLDIHELESVMNKDSPDYEKLMRMKEDKDKPIKIENNPKYFKTGLFDLEKNDLSLEEKQQYDKWFNEAQKKDNVMFRQVLSFSTEGLIKAGIYNPYNKELNREPLIEATRKMMNVLYKKENINESVKMVGAIHYNTEHFHLHLSSVEMESNRPLKKYKDQEGNEQLERKGTIKMNTIEEMKSVFINSVFDRSKELEQLSELRNNLREIVKENYHDLSHDYQLNKQTKEIVSLLPNERNKWKSKHLSEPCRNKMNHLINNVMQNNDTFNLYKNLAKEENKFKEQTYGKLPKGQSSFYENRMNDIYYRLSNSILEEWRKDPYIQQMKDKEIKKSSQQLSKASKKQTTHNIAFNLKGIHYSMKQMEKATKKSFEKQQLEWEHERMNQEIEFEKQQLELE